MDSHSAAEATLPIALDIHNSLLYTSDVKAGFSSQPAVVFSKPVFLSVTEMSLLPKRMWYVVQASVIWPDFLQ